VERQEFNRFRALLEKRLAEAFPRDRARLGNELDRLKKACRKFPLEEALVLRLRRIEALLDRSVREREKRKGAAPRIVYPENLPITEKRAEIVDAVRRHPVIVITGETGSGKTTQIPKMCIEAGRGVDGFIGCTQPRRIAAVTVAMRVAEELGEAPGRSVGYKIRFENRSRRENFIKFMTDGILLMETQEDPLLERYDTIIVDEAHERSVNIDFVLAMLRRILSARKDLKVIISSATIDTEKFSRAFSDAPIIEVSGRTWPVDVIYRPLDPEKEEKGEENHVEAAVDAVREIAARRDGGGDILVFMPTEEDIRETCALLSGPETRGAAVLPLYARLPAAEQRRVFTSFPGRKIIVATNIAETSITIPGIRYVVDTGLARISQYSPRTGTKSLPVRPVSKSSADQRKGRCGRVREGICIRLYSREDYEARPLFTTPEILRSDLAEVILRMLSLNIDPLPGLPFIDPPNPRLVHDGIDLLLELGAVEKGDAPGGGPAIRLTGRGRIMARLPIDPRVSRILLEARDEKCLKEVLVIAGALSSQDPRERPPDREEEADRVHRAFLNPSSDFIALLNIWNAFESEVKDVRSAGRLRKFCRSRFLSWSRMREWRDIHGELSEIMEEEGFSGKGDGLEGEALYRAVHRSLLSGFLSRVAQKKEKNLYRKARGGEVMLFPGSGLFNKGGAWIVAAEIVETTRPYARTAAAVQADWIEDIGGHLCRSTYSEPYWDEGREEVMATEKVSFLGLVLVPGRTVSFGRIRPEEAGELFVRGALIEGRMRRKWPFLEHNRKIVEEIREIENRIRRRDFLLEEDLLLPFYRKRLPGIHDTRTLGRKIRTEGGDGFLKLSREEALRTYEGTDLSQFPGEFSLDGRRLPLTYRFLPGDAADGVTVTLPSSLSSTVPLDRGDWLVPGYRREKIGLLLKGLPKAYRKQLFPIAEAVETVHKELTEEEGENFLTALGRFLHRRYGVDIPGTAWPVDALPDHLKMRFAVIDEKGQEIRAGRNPEELKIDFALQGDSPALRKARKTWEREGITQWDLGDLPESIEIGTERGHRDVVHPGLRVEEGVLSLRLFRDGREAVESHREGVSFLYGLHFSRELRALRKNLAVEGNLKKWSLGFGGPRKLEERLFGKVMKDLFQRDIRTEKAFGDYAVEVRPFILPAGKEVFFRVVGILGAWAETVERLREMEDSNRSRKPIVEFLAGLRRDLDRLVPEDFIECFDEDRSARLPRYLKALVVRAERGAYHLEKDTAKAREVEGIRKNWEELAGDLAAGASAEKKKAVEEFSVLLEEFRVSVFAPELKTAFPVSKKRLEERLQEIRRMI
jgi:ATP-dependent helicase HrpA